MKTSREFFHAFAWRTIKKYVWDRNESKQLKEVPRCNWIRRRQVLAQLVWCRLVIGAMIQSNKHIQRMWNEKNSRHCKGPWAEQERLKSAPTTCIRRQSIRLSPAYCCHLIINYLTLCKFYADEALFTYIFQIKRASESRSCDSSRPLAWEKAHIFHSLKFVSGRLRHLETGWWSRFAVFSSLIPSQWWIVDGGEMSRTDKCHSHPRPFVPRSLFWKLLYSTTFSFRVNGWVERDRKRK